MESTAMNGVEEQEVAEVPETEGKVLCDNCGSLHDEETCERVFSFNDNTCSYDEKLYCPTCLEGAYFCDNCSAYYDSNKNFIYPYRRIVCPECAGSYCYCNHCEEYVHEDDYSSDRDCCYSCLDNGVLDTGVADYHEGAEEWNYIGKSKSCWKEKWRGIGIELEIDRESQIIEIERRTVKLLCDISHNIYFEHDGSLDGGFEIITHPHTLKEFFKIDWKRILQVCEDQGYDSHSAGTCGLHIHISRNMFGRNKQRQDNSIAKLINFFEVYWNDCLKVSRRTQKQADSYAGRYAKDIDINNMKNIKALGKDRGKGRFFAVNNENENTVEIRLMRGTLNYDSFMACIDFCLTLVKNCTKVLWKEINDVFKWLRGIKQSTKNYIKTTNAFEGVIEKCA